MKFFMNGQYSTAQKIIASVEKKLIENLKASLPQSEKKLYVGGFDIRLVGAHKLGERSNKLTEILGSILIANFPSSLYSSYQQKSKEDKKILRTIIFNAYLQAIQDSIQDVVTDISISPNDDFIAAIFLPKFFYDEKELAKKLLPALHQVRKILLSQNELSEFQNTI